MLFWQGGFMFYAAVVVPVGSQVLGSHQQQARVTRSVTDFLNLAGGISILAWSWEVAANRDPSQRRRRWRWTLLSLLALSLPLLVWMHARLESLLDEPSDDFYGLHRWYLNVSALQWAASAVLLAVTLFAWREEDRRG
jgi:hypothetical protein